MGGQLLIFTSQNFRPYYFFFSVAPVDGLTKRFLLPLPAIIIIAFRVNYQRVTFQNDFASEFFGFLLP